MLSPSIWTPRESLGAFIDRLRRWRAPLYAAAHLKKDPVTGHLLKNPAGHLVKACADSFPCTSCVRCQEGTTPAYFDVTLNIANFASCMESGGLYYTSVGLSNGTFRVPYLLTNSGTCVYEMTPDPGFYLLEYDLSDCSDAPFDFGDHASCFLQVLIRDTFYRLIVEHTTGLGGLWFDGRISRTDGTSCHAGSFVLSNDIVSPGLFGADTTGGWGGNATVTPGGGPC